MKFLADESIPAMAIKALEEDRHEVLWLRQAMPGIVDSAVVALARGEGRVILTCERAFAEFAEAQALPANSGVVLFELSTLLPRSIAMAATRIAATLVPSGRLEVITEERVRTTRVLTSRIPKPTA
jgi:predicted nuclease of predicted toxin-antitoxin system